MIKTVIFLSIFAIASYARVIGGVAVLVDGMPITTFEIKDFARQNHISINDATNALVQQKLQDEEIERLGISATDSEIEQAMQNLAKANNLDIDSFKRQVLAEGKNLYEVKKQIAQKIKRQKLFDKILMGSISKPTDEDLKRIYQQHYNDFNMPTKVDVLQLVSNDPERIKQKIKTPAFPIDGVGEVKTTLPLNAIPPQLAQTLVKTKVGRFTPVMSVGGGKYVSLKVLKKYTQSVSFEQAKQKLMMGYLAERKQAKLIEYFEKKKAEATIKTIRKP